MGWAGGQLHPPNSSQWNHMKKGNAEFFHLGFGDKKFETMLCQLMGSEILNNQAPVIQLIPNGVPSTGISTRFCKKDGYVNPLESI